MSKIQDLWYYRTYSPAVLKQLDSIGWVIEFHLLNTETNKLKRHRVKLNVLRKHCSNLAEFKVQAMAEVMQINNRLMMLHGCSAHFEEKKTTTERQKNEESLEIVSALAQYYDSVSGELRRATLVSYHAFVRQFSDWLRKQHPHILMCDLSHKIAVQYMDYVFQGGNNGGKVISPRTYNNNLKFLRTWVNWCKEHALTEDNPFEKMKTKRELPKERCLIPKDVRDKITSYLVENNKPYLIICHLIYSSLLRPVEISRIQVNQIDFDKKCIHMPASKTKTYYAKDARLTDTLVDMLRKHIEGAKSSDYLFADKSWRPGAKPMSSHTYGNVWCVLRETLRLPKEMQLYSLRDTAINGMLKAGVDSLSVMQAADHHDLSITTRYANHADDALIEKLNKSAPEF